MRPIRVLTLVLLSLTASCENCFRGESALAGFDDRERCVVRGLIDVLNDQPRAGLLVDAQTEADSIRAVTDRFGNFTFPREILCTGIARIVEPPADLWFPRMSQAFGVTEPPIFDAWAGDTITGSATWNGTPVAGVTLEATATLGPEGGRMARGVSGADGAVRLDRILFDEVGVTAVGGLPGDPALEGAQWCWTEAGTCATRPVLFLPSQADQAHFELRFQGASVLRGQVTIDGEPAPGLTLQADGPWPAEVRSDASGSWEIPNLPPGRYSVALSGFDPEEVEFPVTEQEGLLEGGDRVTLDFAGTRRAPNAPPVVSITAPAAGTSVPRGARVVFRGTAVDPEDGDLPAASLQWSSSLNGPLGTGSPLEVTTLATGSHLITLTAVDSGARTGSDTLSVEIVAAARIEGRVTLNGEQPVPSLGVGLTGNGLVREASTGVDGRYVLLGLPPGTYTVALRPPAGTTVSPISVSVTLQAEDVAVVDFDLSPVGEG